MWVRASWQGPLRLRIIHEGFPGPAPAPLAAWPPAEGRVTAVGEEGQGEAGSVDSVQSRTTGSGDPGGCCAPGSSWPLAKVQLLKSGAAKAVPDLVGRRALCPRPPGARVRFGESGIGCAPCSGKSAYVACDATPGTEGAETGASPLPRGARVRQGWPGAAQRAERAHPSPRTRSRDCWALFSLLLAPFITSRSKASLKSTL